MFTQQRHEDFQKSTAGKTVKKVQDLSSSLHENIIERFWPPPTSVLVLLSLPVIAYLLKKIFVGV